GHVKYASDGTSLSTNGPIEPSISKKILKESRSDEKLKKEKRKTMGGVSIDIKASAMAQLEKFVSSERLRKSKPVNDSVSDDDYNTVRGRTPSPLLPTVRKTKTMPITPPPSILNSRLPPPVPNRSVSYNSSTSKNFTKKSDHDNNSSITSEARIRRLTVNGSTNSSSMSPPKSAN
ncbi:24306_t:CDS:1, partial [Racocetra persica]